MKCLNCGSNIMDGTEYIAVKEKNFCSIKCAKEHLLAHPEDAVNHYIEDFAQIYDSEFQNPYA